MVSPGEVVINVLLILKLLAGQLGLAHLPISFNNRLTGTYSRYANSFA